MNVPNLSLQVKPIHQGYELVWTNHSKDKIRIWQLQNSWGWHSLAVDVFADRSYVLHPEEQEWTRNGPGWVEIEPGKSHSEKFPELIRWNWLEVPPPSTKWKSWKVSWLPEKCAEMLSHGIYDGTVSTGAMELDSLLRSILAQSY
jgi:hypothetical protein